MAKVILPLLSGEVSGKVGDIVFFRRYGTQIARRRTTPSNPRTMAQTTVRSNLKALSQAWKGSGDAVITDGSGNRYVVLKKKMPDGTYADVNFNILTMTEKTAWENYAMSTKGYKQWGRLLFISMNIKRLSSGQDPVRTP